MHAAAVREEAISRTIRKANRELMRWPLLGVLSLAALVSFVACARHESSTLQMSWKRGDDHYGPNFIHLESSCLGSTESGCFCSLDFKATTTKEFAGYVGSFGANKVPARFHVDYDANGQVVGAILESVGEWPENRFQVNEKSLGTGFRTVRNQPSVGHHVTNTA